MNKKYIISFSLIALVLVIGGVILALITNHQMDKVEKNKYYKIADKQLLSLAEVSQKDVKLSNFNYTTDNGISCKVYDYQIKNAEEFANSYGNYLTLGEEFQLVSQETNSQRYEKHYEDADKFEVVLKVSDNSLKLELIYTDYKD